MRTKIELLVSTIVDVLISKLMKDYHSTYLWAYKTIHGSKTYQRIIQDIDFRNESPLYIYQFLKDEVEKSKVVY